MPGRKRSASIAFGGSGPGVQPKKRKMAVARAPWGKQKLKIQSPIIGAAPLEAGRQVTFKFVEALTLNPGVGVVADHLYAANGMFDPDITGGGHQPLGFDQWVGVFYNQYVVSKSTIKVTLWSPGTAEFADTYICGISLNDNTDSLTGTAPSILMEQPRNTYRLLTNSGGSRGTMTLTKTFDCKKFFKQGNILGDDRVRASHNANPSRLGLFHVWAGAADEATDASALHAHVEITYTCSLLEPNNVVGS